MSFTSREWTLADLRKYAPEDERGCWVWSRFRRKQGYGQMRVRGETVYAHRVAYSLRYGPIAKGVVVHHLCENKACINPGHMSLITQSDHERLHRASRLEAWRSRRSVRCAE